MVLGYLTMLVALFGAWRSRIAWDWVEQGLWTLMSLVKQRSTRSTWGVEIRVATVLRHQPLAAGTFVEGARRSFPVRSSFARRSPTSIE